MTVSVFQKVPKDTIWRTERIFHRRKGKVQILELKNQLDPRTLVLWGFLEICDPTDKAQKGVMMGLYSQWKASQRPALRSPHSQTSECSFHLPCFIRTEWDDDVCVCVSLHQTILWHQLGILQFNSFSHYLPGGSIRFHRSEAQSYKTAPTSYTNRRYKLSAELLTEIPMNPSSGSVNLLEQLTETRNVYLNLPVY